MPLGLADNSPVLPYVPSYGSISYLGPLGERTDSSYFIHDGLVFIVTSGWPSCSGSALPNALTHFVSPAPISGGSHTDVQRDFLDQFGQRGNFGMSESEFISVVVRCLRERVPCILSVIGELRRVILI